MNKILKNYPEHSYWTFHKKLDILMGTKRDNFAW